MFDPALFRVFRAFRVLVVHLPFALLLSERFDRVAHEPLTSLRQSEDALANRFVVWYFERSFNRAKFRRVDRVLLERLDDLLRLRRFR